MQSLRDLKFLFEVIWGQDRKQQECRVRLEITC